MITTVRVMDFVETIKDVTNYINLLLYNSRIEPA